MRIFLLGFMGSGKSFWGRLWASTHHLTFFDLDEEIEKQEGLSIAGIFEKKGEDYFRQKETSLLQSFDKYDDCIIACGGGSPCFFDNMEWMNKNGKTVFLAATPQYLLNNIKNEKDKRPLLKNTNDAELLFFIEQKLKERLPFYNRANVILDAEKINSDSFKKVYS